MHTSFWDDLWIGVIVTKLDSVRTYCQRDLAYQRLPGQQRVMASFAV
ncbi:MAG: hypothetical protein H6555_09240 [Lewinellaceae bacterium]|nr:hypothetical protein [Lewinellaceae bacterium]